MITPFFVDSILIAGPFLAFILSAAIKVRRKRARIERDGPEPTKPFDSSPKPLKGLFTPLLLRYDDPERQYLSEQLAAAVVGTVILAWPLTVLLSTSLLPASIARNAFMLTRAAAVWYTYLQIIPLVTTIAAIGAILTGFIAAATFLSSAPTAFYRTRPLPRRFVFWTRMTCAFATLLISVTSAILLSLTLVLAFYGPVWRHLTDGNPGAVLLPAAAALRDSSLSRHQLHQVLALLDTSAPRLFLSMLTTLALVFSVTVALVLQPFGRGSSRPGITGLTLVFAIFFATQAGSVFSYLPRSRWVGPLFFYGRLGPPPPYADALMPVLLSAALLLLAQLFVNRREA